MQIKTELTSDNTVDWVFSDFGTVGVYEKVAAQLLWKHSTGFEIAPEVVHHDMPYAWGCVSILQDDIERTIRIEMPMSPEGGLDYTHWVMDAQQWLDVFEIWKRLMT